MVNDIIIRTFKTSDREMVRQIAGDTANRGKPVETFFSERWIVVNLLTDYYITYEPQNLFVAEYHGEVVGYLTGCLLPERFNWKMNCFIIPRIFFQSVVRGVFLKSQSWWLIKMGLLTFLKGGFTKHIPFDRFPGHLHVNLKEGHRGQRIGERLMKAFLSEANKVGLKGVHAIVREENIIACRFFEKMGFQKLSRHPLIRNDGNRESLGHTVVYGKNL